MKRKPTLLKSSDLLVALSVIVLTSCGAEQGTTKPRIAQALNPGLTTNATSNATTDIMLQNDYSIQSGTSTAISISPHEKLDCTKAVVTWSIASGSGLSITSSNSCTITASADAAFSGEALLRAETVFNNQKFVFTARLQKPTDMSCKRQILIARDGGGSWDCSSTIAWEKDINSCLKKGGDFLATDQAYAKFKQDNGAFPCLKLLLGHADLPTCLKEASKAISADLTKIDTSTLATSGGAHDVKTSAFLGNFCIGTSSGYCDSGFILHEHTFDKCPQ